MTAEHATPLAARVDEVVERLTQGEKSWAATSLEKRGEMLDVLVELTDRHADEWVRVASTIKHLPADSPLVGEEWISGPWATASALQSLRQTIGRMAAGEGATSGFHARAVPGGRVAMRVLPHSTYDRLLLNGFSAEVWLEPGVGEKEARDTAGLGLRDPARTNGVTLVLGAGNIFSIAPLDTIYQLYAENRVVALKLNPISEPLLPVFEAIFAPFIELGVVEILTGGADIGGLLAHHPGVAAVHMTGSENTHDAIVWGVGEDRARNKSADTPLLTKPITSELGGVAPVIVVPGAWSKADLTFQARHVATQRLHNSGSNCIAAQVVIVSSDWPQKDEFLELVKEALADAPPRPSWYPGSADRVASARATHPECAHHVGGTPDRTLLTLDLQRPEDPAFSDEYFAPVLGVAELPATGADFLRAAVTAANEKLRGTLGANIIVHPRTVDQVGEEFEEIVADLRYGTIGINAWTGVGYLTANATWGAFPGHRLDDVQSGIGVVHNALLLERPERTVVRGPFRPTPRSILHGEWTLSPKPPWFVDNRTADVTGRRLARLAASPSFAKLPGIFASALRG
ncbi:aldehyde dehydrogenase family protein [Rhodococcus gannanensis]|uniref:Aldehyde dehydrogenase family protein n=1 Tax=Rhodococcus gannanensis TaxID=1960308 RepID=A0ABW4PB54_9NOCA